jgi:hypothetical protein
MGSIGAGCDVLPELLPRPGRVTGRLSTPDPDLVFTI